MSQEWVYRIWEEVEEFTIFCHLTHSATKLSRRNVPEDLKHIVEAVGTDCILFDAMEGSGDPWNGLIPFCEHYMEEHKD